MKVVVVLEVDSLVPLKSGGITVPHCAAAYADLASPVSRDTLLSTWLVRAWQAACGNLAGWHKHPLGTVGPSGHPAVKLVWQHLNPNGECITEVDFVLVSGGDVATEVGWVAEVPPADRYIFHRKPLKGVYGPSLHPAATPSLPEIELFTRVIRASLGTPEPSDAGKTVEQVLQDVLQSFAFS